MSSAPIRMVIGPAIARLRDRTHSSRDLLNRDPDDAVMRRLAKNRFHLRRTLRRLGTERQRWQEILDSKEGQALEEEEEVFREFKMAGLHFTEWMEQAEEVIDEITVALEEDLDNVSRDSFRGDSVHGDAAADPQLPPQDVEDIHGEVRDGDQPPPVAGHGGNQAPPGANPNLHYRDAVLGQVRGGAGQNPPVGDGRRGPAPLAGPGQQVGQLLAKLPDQKLPLFEGDPLQWPSFWEAFQSQVERRPMEPVDKLYYLLGCLKGRAGRAVAGYQGGENYQNVVDALKRNFGQPHIIADALEAELMNLPQVEDSVESLQSFTESLERICRQLVALGHPENTTMVNLVKNRLPKAILMELVKMERSEGRRWQLTDYRRGLSELVAVREEVHRFTETFKQGPKTWFDDEQGSNSAQEARVFAITKSNREKKRPHCLFCSSDHWSSDCRTVADIGERARMLNEQERCRRCLRKGHKTYECPFERIKCRECGGPHSNVFCTIGSGTKMQDGPKIGPNQTKSGSEAARTN